MAAHSSAKCELCKRFTICIYKRATNGSKNNEIQCHAPWRYSCISRLKVIRSWSTPSIFSCATSRLAVAFDTLRRAATLVWPDGGDRGRIVTGLVSVARDYLFKLKPTPKRGILAHPVVMSPPTSPPADRVKRQHVSASMG